MSQAPTEMMLKLTVLTMVVLSTQGSGQYFRRLRFGDYELKSGPMSTRGFRSLEPPDFRSHNRNDPVSRAFIFRGSATNPFMGSMPYFPNFVQTFVTQDSDGENSKPSPYPGANPFSSLFSMPNVIVISSADGLAPPAGGGVPHGEPVPAKSPARGNFLRARTAPPYDGLRQFRFDDLLDY